jgi:hypothetical protein
MLSVELQQIRDQADEAVRVTDADAGASPVLAAVVRELAAKSGKAVELAGSSREWEAVVEVEQAADSARVAARADRGAAEGTTASVEAAHLAICMLKANVAPSAR